MPQNIDQYAKRRFLRLHTALLGGGILFGILAVCITEFANRGAFVPVFDTGFNNSLLASIATLLLAHFTYMKLDRLPGSSPQLMAIPTLMLFFFIVIAGLFFSRLEYSRTMLGGGFLGMLFWYFIATFTFRRVEMGRIGMCPGVSLADLIEIRGVEWIELDSPNNREWELDAVVIGEPGNLTPKWKQFITQCRLDGIPVYQQNTVQEHLTGKVDINDISADKQASFLSGKNYLFLRHIVDRLIAFIFLPISIFLLAIIAFAIKLDDGGPVFYKQKRTGFKGREFTIYKLRTMKAAPDIENEREAAKTKTNDQRITRFGRFLRKSRLDETPQIFNILLGQMAWIGPRPNATPLSNWYRSEFGQYDLRYLVPPGITGWAQVNQGHVSTLEDEREKVAYDLYYAKHVSFSLDALIVLKTIKVVLTGRGAR